MTPIQNSPLKEGIRQRNVEIARSEASQINQRLSSQIAQFKYKSKTAFTGFGIAGGIVGIFIGANMNKVFFGILFGLALGVVGWLLYNTVYIKSYNSDIDGKKQRLQSKADAEIATAFHNADMRTQQEIASYEAEVEQYFKKIMRNAENLTPMIENVISMMNRMISHADTRSHMRFVEADLVYQVITTGIKYSYLSKYTNPQDDYVFDVARYHDLNNDAECEGLAQALAKLTIKRMKATNSANSFNISVDHCDAQVTLHYKGANKNFVPGRDIY